MLKNWLHSRKFFLTLFTASGFLFFFFLNIESSLAVGEVTLLNDYTVNDKSLIGDTSNVTFQSFLRMLVQLAIGLIVMGAVVFIVVGGVTYVTTDTFTGKSKGKDIIQRAFLGLGLAIASFLILHLLNPRILNNEKITLEKIEVNTCGAIKSESEWALSQWNKKAENEDWEYAGGPYYTSTKDSKTGAATLCKPNLAACQTQVKKIHEYSGKTKDGKEREDNSGYYAKCLVCSGKRGVASSSLTGGDSYSSGKEEYTYFDGKSKCESAEEGATAQDGDQVFLYLCEAYEIDTKFYDKTVDCVESGLVNANMTQEQINKLYKEAEKKVKDGEWKKDCTISFKPWTKDHEFNEKCSESKKKIKDKYYSITIELDCHTQKNFWSSLLSSGQKSACFYYSIDKE